MYSTVVITINSYRVSYYRKVRTVVTNRFLRFLQERAQREPEEYAKFYKDYGIFLKEGIIVETEQLHKVHTSTHTFLNSGFKMKVSLQDSGLYCSFPLTCRRRFLNFYDSNLLRNDLGMRPVFQSI